LELDIYDQNCRQDVLRQIKPPGTEHRRTG
jgi:hypothetical protein